MYNKLIQISQNILKALFSDEKLSQLQRQLILANFNLKIEEFFIIITTLTMTTTTIVAIIVEILKMTHIITLIVLISIPTVTINYIIYKNEKIKDQIEEDLPLYLRSISSLLKVGVGLEGALYELTENMTGPLNNEIKIALTEIQFGKTFNDALKSITKRNKSENLKNTIEIIIHTRNAGANLAEILEMIADDLTQTLQLKGEKGSCNDVCNVSINCINSSNTIFIFNDATIQPISSTTWKNKSTHKFNTHSINRIYNNTFNNCKLSNCRCNVFKL